MYHCFGCGVGGNVITFVMEYENFTFPEAVKLLADRAGVDLPVMEYSGDDRRERDIKTKLLEINKIAATFYYHQLKSPAGQDGLAYLKGRQLSDKTINTFGLGFAPQLTVICTGCLRKRDNGTRYKGYGTVYLRKRCKRKVLEQGHISYYGYQ